jgi:hypothetical protein
MSERVIHRRHRMLKYVVTNLAFIYPWEIHGIYTGFLFRYIVSWFLELIYFLCFFTSLAFIVFILLVAVQNTLIFILILNFRNK